MRNMQQSVSEANKNARTLCRIFQFGGTVMLLSALIWGLSQPAMAGDRACSNTSLAAFSACKHEAKDDYWIARGNCLNISDEADRRDCMGEANAALPEAIQECRDQFRARLEVCDAIGEAPYDPEIDPRDFVKPKDIFDGSVNPNPYFPLGSGYNWKYHTLDENGEITETITDEVLKKTKKIMGVKCIVVHDVAYDGDSTDRKDIKEDTYDYYAQDREGNVWYFGEFSLNFEEKLPDMEGSWIFGLDGGKPGIIMSADPQVGDVYRQEFHLGDAEDMAEILAVDTDTVDNEMPFPCDGDCVQTKDYSPIEPDVVEFKYYKSGVGVVREENLDAGEVVELVDKSF